MDNLLKWYARNRRELPFRKTKDPYKVWLSEIIMQQTRVDQGVSYYERFVSRYPTVQDLALANEDDVLNLWQGLGYYSRARNLLSAAKTIVEELNGQLPKTYVELKKLKGVGDYTAAAIASICFNEKVPVVDGNVYRVLSRLLADSTPIDSSAGQKKFKSFATEYLNENEPGDHNQALMELGALVCTPTNPVCSGCPLNMECISFAQNKQILYPVKKKKVKQRRRFLYLYIIRYKSYTYIQKRNLGDIWAGLFQFPLHESSTELIDKKIVSTSFIKDLVMETEIKIKHISPAIKHVLSHQNLFAKFVHIEIENDRFFDKSVFFKTDWETLNKFAMPRLITRYLESMNE